MSDLHQAVLDLLGSAGDAKLPSLTRDELFALGDRPALGHAEDDLWWAELDSEARDLVAETAQRGLIARNLIVAGESDPPLAVADPVQIVLRTRNAPAWLLVLGEPGADSTLPAVQVALLGIDLAAHRTSAVLIATRIVGIWAHRLTVPAIAMDAAVSWLLRPPPAGKKTVGRTIEALLPASAPGAGTTDSRAIVMTSGRQTVLSRIGRDGPGISRLVSRADLRGWIIDAIGSLAGAV
jgi:hypothetical protein